VPVTAHPNVCRWVTGQLAVLAAGMGLFVCEVLPSHPGKLLGGSLLTIGGLQVVFHGRAGRRFYARTQACYAHVAGFWAVGGERGTQLLFLGVGVIVAMGGCILIIAR
jgi:hypothetical protein